LSIEKSYLITQEFMCMVGHLDRNGKKCTLVFELNRIFLVDKSPIEILEASIRRVGFNLKGALESSKQNLGAIHMHPFMVNPILGIIVFPTKSHKHEDVIWFNPNHIRRTWGKKKITIVGFQNGQTMIVPMKLAFFNNKLTIAERFRDDLIEGGKNPSSVV
jgi:competence protein ComK